MHNGVFQKLETVLIFYDRYTVRTPTNPETQAPRREPEVRDNISHELLEKGQPQSDQHMAAFIAFMKALTDQRYESLQGSE